MQLKFLTLGFISAALFSNAVFAHGGSLISADDTNIQITEIVSNVLNNLNAHGLLKNANLDVLSHIASRKGDARFYRRRLHDALRRREWERDENENEPDEEEEDEDENEADEEEEDENEPDEDEADESSVSKVYRRSVDEEALDVTPEEEEEEEMMTEEEDDESNEDEEQDESEDQDQDEVRMARRSTPGAQTDGTDQTSGGNGIGGLVQTATGVITGVAPLP